VLEVFETGWRGDGGPVNYGAVGISAAAIWRIKLASGQAAAKASRTRDAVSINPRAELQKPQSNGGELGIGERVAFGMASRTVSISQ
jgi:hypothetical protein